MKFPWWLLAAWLIAPASPAQPATPRPPNIVLILADDLGWTDAGFAGSRFYETPHLDALAAGGMRFTSFYASPVGLPSQAALLTGQYSPRTRVYTGDILPAGETGPAVTFQAGSANLPSLLKGAGYTTGYIGVWGLGAEGDAHPLRRGFDEAILTTARHIGFEVEPAAEVPSGMHQVDYLTDRALEFLDRHRDRPFFLEIAHFSVHEPTEPKPAWVGRFEKKPPAGGHRDAAYAAMIAGLDESVGRIVARLETLHLTGQTIILFTSDNGGVGGYLDADNPSRRAGLTDNSPLRGGKGMIYEGGLRVPFLVRWPGVVTGGSRSTAPVMMVDLLPTLCDAAGVRLPGDLPIDGINLIPLWRNAGAHLGRDAVFWHFPAGVEAAGRAIRTPPVSIVRAGNFKLIEWLEDGRMELYNVVEDLGEKNNLVRSLPDKAAELKDKVAAWRKELGAPLPPPETAAPASLPPTPPAPAPATAPEPKVGS